ncbi:sulfide/dihydroorotate dehydrogenase-like FAD/NAD-binding protein [Fervidobacterium thailandense]|uniref:Dihydroorotate dehydrogenase n=1 Tax=Fervidobacterium thailandense TaxID=1008305 RepID=A0A1E3G0P9_9BACT|nr:sulfide/dihydroorotate dehydrogenase-like FAD/NAD-binding protein [Fervidobacterium thailandense]ODN29802.1 dihydroorotate dehydrogenase [Fervidobacterium thailandense]
MEFPENTIVRKRRFAPKLYEFWIRNSLVSRKAKPGQFVIVRTSERGERIPLTIVDTRPGEFRLVVKAVGKSTYELCMKNEGDVLADVVGPLGKPSEVRNYGNVLVLGGGVGIAAVLPIARALKEEGNKLTVILGARTIDELILRDEFGFCDELLLTTDDGSLGIKGTVVDAMRELVKEKKFDVAWAVGPAVMMKFASYVAKEHNFPIWVSLNSIMVDGTGMCGGCRVTLKDEKGSKIEYTCVDGPEFDGRFVDWDVFMNRLTQYREQERLALEKFLAEVGDVSWL